MSPPRTVLAAACGALVLSCAAPGGALAATLTADQACYLEQGAIGLTGTGFAPGAGIAISGEQIFLSGNAGADGGFRAGVTAPLLGTIQPAAKAFAIAATEQSTGTSASVTVHVATGAFSTSTGVRSPTATRTWKFSGLFQHPGAPIYGHFRLRGRTYADYRFGVPQAPCGTLTVKAPGIPLRSPASGKWTILVDFSPRYVRRADPRLSGTTTVFTTYTR
jgi:hypothetical protein